MCVRLGYLLYHELKRFYQGLLLVAILSVGDPSETFNNGVNVTKVYMAFILAFVAITNIIVSQVSCS